MKTTCVTPGKPTSRNTALPLSDARTAPLTCAGSLKKELGNKNIQTIWPKQSVPRTTPKCHLKKEKEL